MQLEITLHVDSLPSRPQPVPRWLNGPQVRNGVDFEVNDPRYTPDNEPYTSRTTGTPHTVPMANKLEGGESQPMDYAWSKFWRDCLGLYVPAAWHFLPFDRAQGEGAKTWEFLGGFIPATILDQWFLHLIHGARALTNKTGPNNPGFYDPYTGFGTPNEDGSPPRKFYMKEPVTLGNNICSQSSGRRIWALDGFEAPPALEDVRDRFDLLHIFTQSAPNVMDRTPGTSTPNGIWPIPGAPQAGDNIVVHPIISRWTNGSVRWAQGLHLREINLPPERLCAQPAPDARITWPFIPNVPLIRQP